MAFFAFFQVDIVISIGSMLSNYISIEFHEYFYDWVVFWRHLLFSKVSKSTLTNTLFSLQCQSQWQARNYQKEKKSGVGLFYQCPKPAYQNPNWRANSGSTIIDISKSLNVYINRSKIHRYSNNNFFCFRCEISNHKSMDQQCTNLSLLQGEQFYFKQMIYDNI